MVNRVVACAVAAATISGVARAEVSFSFMWGQSSVELLPGATVAVPLFLTETVTGGSLSILAAENGLSSAGVAVMRSETSLPAPTDAAFMTLAGVLPNTVDFFDSTDPFLAPDLSVSANGNFARLLIFARDAGVVGTLESDGVRRLLLGTITFTAGTVAGETTVFSTGDFDQNTSETITWQNFRVLDGEIASSSIRISTIIPSPSSAAGLAMLTLLTARRRR